MTREITFFDLDEMKQRPAAKEVNIDQIILPNGERIAGFVDVLAVSTREGKVVVIMLPVLARQIHFNPVQARALAAELCEKADQIDGGSGTKLHDRR